MPSDQGGGRVEFNAGSEAVPEHGTFPYTVSLFDDVGNPLPAAVVSGVVATLVAVPSGVVLFTARDVKNINGGTLVNGRFALVVSGAPDLALQADEAWLTYGERRLTITITAIGTGGTPLPILREVVFFLRNLREVPAP